ncbi:MAG: metallophosphoesterase, partial [Gammaproteobacteria bacterium]|nr:metallophosphoesterase [Gammaproteobacteria bacterium]
MGIASKAKWAISMLWALAWTIGANAAIEPGSGEEAGAGERKPWTHLRTNADPDEFQFAIISDRAGGMRPGVFKAGMEKLNRMHPEFIISVGDLIVGWDEEINNYVADADKINHRWDEFERIVADSKAPFFYVAGNNDVYTDVMRKHWRDRFGPTYYSFTYKDVLFLVLNTDDPPNNRPGGFSEAQLAWLKAELKKNKNARWTMLFMHRPLWAQNPEAWWQVEELISDRPRTVFAGHRHRYFYQEIDGYKYLTLATTGGSSDLSGIANGRFDHVTWVTVTAKGPKIVNLLLDGIWSA